MNVIECDSTAQNSLAIVNGQPFNDLPGDLFIPPDALEVLLDSFSGPLDLLLYLIRRQNIDILNIPIALITEQYLRYINFMQAKRMELAADYLVMAAILAEIKSHMLLPQKEQESAEDSEDDPRMNLIKRLQQYEQFKNAATELENLPRCDKDWFLVHISQQTMAPKKTLPDVSIKELSGAMLALLKKQVQTKHHQIQQEPLSVRDRMSLILQQLELVDSVEFKSFLNVNESRGGIIVTLLAILELSKQSLLMILQHDNFSTIYIRALSNG